MTFQKSSFLENKGGKEGENPMPGLLGHIKIQSSMGIIYKKYNQIPHD